MRKKSDASGNYSLKSEAIDQLVNAADGETPEYTPEELNRFRTGGKFKIPMLVKVLFIKAWFPGAVCFFFLWGLGTYVSAMLDMLFILGIVLGMVTDLLVNNTLRFIESYPGENSDRMLLPKKGMVSFVGNIVYSFVLVVCIFVIYNLINIALNALLHTESTVYLGVEPIVFGILYMLCDCGFIGIRHFVLSIFRDAAAKARNN